MASLKTTPPVVSGCYGRRSDLAASLYGHYERVQEVADQSISNRLLVDSEYYRRRSDLNAALYGYEEVHREVLSATASTSTEVSSISATERLLHYQSSAGAVFAVCELLEFILVNMELLNILRLRRVDKFWNNLINNSKALARTMYMVLGSLPVEHYNDRQLHNPQYNHLILKRIMAEKPYPKHGYMIYFDVCRAHPLITSKKVREVGNPEGLSRFKFVTEITARLFEAKPGTTLARTLITQSPATQANFVWQINCSCHKHRHRKSKSPFADSTLTRTGGITVGDVYKEFLMASRSDLLRTQVKDPSCLKFAFLAYAPKK
ncbi:hypothetical protein LTR95_002026 [Oleoguttula sp. CCFEE 5521]